VEGYLRSSGIFFDYVRQLGHDAQPDYASWKEVFCNLGSCNGITDLVFGAYHPVDDHVGPSPWCPPETPEVFYPSADDDTDGLDSDDEDFSPTMDWHPPKGVKEEDLLGDEEKMLKNKVAVMAVPPVMLPRCHSHLASGSVEIMVN